MKARRLPLRLAFLPEETFLGTFQIQTFVVLPKADFESNLKSPFCTEEHRESRAVNEDEYYCQLTGPN